MEVIPRTWIFGEGEESEERVSTEFRKQFEEWAEESFGGDAKRFFVRCDPPHEDEYQHADVQMAWMAAQYFCARGPAGAATRVALKERLVGD